jgi:ribosome-associated translation inhibitor RaiA
MTLASRDIEISGLRGNRSLRAAIATRLSAVLAPITGRPLAARVDFFDDNGPKGGGARCALTVQLPYRPNLRVEEVATTPRLAFDGGFAALERQIERYRERDRDRRRYPKKYFAAARVNEGERGAVRRPARTVRKPS